MRFTADREAIKKIRRRATKLRRQQLKSDGEAIPIDLWVERITGSPKGDLASGFTCRHCGFVVAWDGGGTGHRNHCPNCLHSVHLDVEPGDRDADCGGIMEPISVWVRKGGEWAVVHRCRDCGSLSSNRIAADDNPALLISVAMRPIAAPPFPIEQVWRSE